MEEVKKERGQSRGRKKGIQSWLPAFAGAAVVFLAGGSGFYIYSAQAYRSVYFPNTTINGLDVSGRSVSEAKAMISANVEAYKLEILARTGPETIGGEEIGLHTSFDTGMEELLEAQNPYQWIFHMASDQKYTVETMIAYDEEKETLDEYFTSLAKSEHYTEVMDAWMADESLVTRYEELYRTVR